MLSQNLAVGRHRPDREKHLVMPILWKPLQRRIDLYDSKALRFAKSLRKSFPPKTVHKLRTHLRRLQAYAEFLEHREIAARFAKAVSWLSRLRALHVCEAYLKRTGASEKDRCRLQRAVRKEEKLIRAKNRLKKLTGILTKAVPEKMERPNIVIRDRLETLRNENRAVLLEALGNLSPRPTRKELHRFRLLVKSLRYQQEIAVELRWANPRTVRALKRPQSVLGDFCDRDQDLRLAKELAFSGRKNIKKDRCRSLKHAHRALQRLVVKQTHPSIPA
jgi:CHAD domain-containing protein